MKHFVFLLVIAALYSSCCKCDFGSNDASFRFVNSAGADLVFGPTSFYDKDSIHFYFRKGADSLPTHSLYYLPSAPSKDSVIGVSFREDGGDTCYVSFGNGDVDTIILNITKIGGGCCDESLEINPLKYNTKSVSGSVITITK